VNKSTPTALKHFLITALSSLFQKLLIHDIRHQLASTDLLSTSSTDICLSTSVLARKKKIPASFGNVRSLPCTNVAKGLYIGQVCSKWTLDTFKIN
jgi:hypothetical protein